MSYGRTCVVLLTVIMLLVCAGTTPAQEKKEITVTGKVVCAACALKLADKCAVGILTSEGEKYVLTKNDESQKLFPKRYDGLMAMVTGTVEVKGKGKYAKKYLTATKIEVAEPPKE